MPLNSNLPVRSVFAAIVPLFPLRRTTASGIGAPAGFCTIPCHAVLLSWAAVTEAARKNVRTVRKTRVAETGPIDGVIFDSLLVMRPKYVSPSIGGVYKLRTYHSANSLVKRFS